MSDRSNEKGVVFGVNSCKSKFSIICQFLEISPSSRELINLRKVVQVLVDMQGSLKKISSSRKYSKFAKLWPRFRKFQVCEKIVQYFSRQNQVCEKKFSNVFENVSFAIRKKWSNVFETCQDSKLDGT